MTRERGREMGGSVRWIGSSVAFALLIVLLVVLILRDVPRTVWYAVIPTYRYSEVRADLTVDGVRLDVSAVGGCRYREDIDFPLVNSLRAGYYLEGGVLAKRLQDGRGVVIVPRTFCTLLRSSPGKVMDWTAYPDHLRGLHIFLLDDADSPNTILYPILPQYLGLPEARVEVRGVFFRERTAAEVTDPTREVGWLSWPKRASEGSAEWKRAKLSDVWVGNFAAIVPEQQWMGVSQLADVYSHQHTPSSDVHAELNQIYSDLGSVDKLDSQIT